MRINEKLKIANYFQNGLENIVMDTSASTDSSSSSKEIDISDLKRIKNMNKSTSAEDTWSI